MPTSSILLQNGVVIVHEASDHARSVKADILVKGNKIDRIAPDIEAPSDTQVIDCTNKILAPGFIDTHRHMYTIGLRGRHGDNLLEDYLVQGILQASNYDPGEIFWGQLAGCMECINAGTTTVVDHSHLNYSKDHPKAAVAATVASGLRSIYSYCFNIRVDSWSPFALNQSFIAPWGIDTLKELSQKAPFGDGRVSLGLAFDGWFLPKEMIVPLFDSVKEMGIKHLTTHNTRSRRGMPSSIEKMEDCGVLSSSTLLSHANFLSNKDIDLIKQRNAHISSTPSIELQMGMGTPACFDFDRDVQSCASLGIDCHNATLASIPAEMRSALQSSRGAHNEKFLKYGKKPAKIYKTVQEAYALGTIAGARAIGMEHQIGSLAEGKFADIIVFDALTPNMICGAQLDPVTTIVMHSTPGDIVTTIVDGVIRKDGSKLEPVHLSADAMAMSGASTSALQWSEIAQELLHTRKTLQNKIEKIDLAAAKPLAMQAFGYDPSMVVESLGDIKQ